MIQQFPPTPRPRSAASGIRRAVTPTIALALGLAGFIVSGERFTTGLWLLWAGLVCWITESLLRRRGEGSGGRSEAFSLVLLAAGGCLGGLSNVSLAGIGLILVIATLVRAVRADLSLIGVSVVAGAGLIGVTTGALMAGHPELAVSGSLTCIVVALVVVLRRNSRHRREAEHQLLTQQLEAERQRAENAALTERARIAGDLHDVLAHSLGALTAQLNAVEALLLADRVAEAKEKVSTSRRLASEGLAEARRAVSALRGPEGFDASLEELLRVHRESGEDIDLATTGVPQRLCAATEQGARRVLQELLANARKHAPGQPVDLEVAWSADRLTIAASNRLVPDSVYPGGLGHGLTAMRERCRRLGGDVRARRTPEDEFSVTCFLPVDTVGHGMAGGA